MKIVLVCAAGMSTSLIVVQMELNAREEDQIIAIPANELTNRIDVCDVILVAPQLRYKMDTIHKIGETYNVPVELIDMRSYGKMDGKMILQQAYGIVEKAKQGG